jgi:hypothetical protein
MTSLFMVTGTSILSDSIYDRFGGSMLSSSTPQQRQAAYQMAETFAALEIGTPLTPQSFTGIFQWHPYSSRLQLPHKRLQSVTTVTALHEVNCTADPVELGGHALIVDADNSVIDLRECNGSASCGCAWATGWNGTAAGRVEITYIAGVPSGLAAAYPGVLQGLTIAADIALQQMIDCGPDGDPSISSFSDSGYSQSTQFLRLTQFGGSARANYAARMFEPLKHKGALRLR